MTILKKNLYVDKIWLENLIESRLEMLTNSLNNIETNQITKLSFNIKQEPLHYQLILEEDKLVNTYIYKDILKLMGMDKKYLYLLEDNFELLPIEASKKLFEEHINLKEIDIIMSRKIESFFDNKLEDYFIIGKNESNFYFYIQLRKEETRETNIINTVSEMVVCNEQEILLDFMANKFNFIEEIADIKAQLFHSYLDKNVMNKKLKNKAKL